MGKTMRFGKIWLRTDRVSAVIQTEDNATILVVDGQRVVVPAEAYEQIVGKLHG